MLKKARRLIRGLWLWATWNAVRVFQERLFGESQRVPSYLKDYLIEPKPFDPSEWDF